MCSTSSFSLHVLHFLLWLMLAGRWIILMMLIRLGIKNYGDKKPAYTQCHWSWQIICIYIYCINQNPIYFIHPIINIFQILLTIRLLILGSKTMSHSFCERYRFNWSMIHIPHSFFMKSFITRSLDRVCLYSYSDGGVA